MKTFEQRMEDLSSELEKVEGFVDHINRMMVAKPYVDDICNSIKSFVTQEMSRLQSMPENERPSALVDMVNSMLTYSNNYAEKHARDMYMLQGRVAEKQEAAKKINDVLQGVKNQKNTEERLSKKEESGKDLSDRSLGERPEKLSDVRNYEKDKSDTVDI